ncbi:PilZ domain protein [bacterium BMS3Bbin05]|nr:PilZ domain protein [bacterium BMS3Bbin05]
MSAEKNHIPGKEERRSYFRVDDVISVVVDFVCLDNEKSEEFLKHVSSSRAFSLSDVSNLPDNDMEGSPREGPEYKKLYGMITELNTKLDFIINHLMLEKEGLLPAEKKLVNISASGIRFIIEHPANIKDIMEIKLLLPTYPPVAVFAYGEVTRVRELDDNKFEVALEYLNMGDSVRDEIIQYTLSNQRETIKKTRERGAK